MRESRMGMGTSRRGLWGLIAVPSLPGVMASVEICGLSLEMPILQQLRRDPMLWGSHARQQACLHSHLSFAEGDSLTITSLPCSAVSSLPLLQAASL